jgi:hypothetical protein
LERKWIGSHPKKRAQKESSWFGEQRCKLGSKARSNSRIQFVSNASKLVPRTLDLGCWSCRPWYNLLGFLLFNLTWPLGVPSTYLRRLDYPMLEQNFVSTNHHHLNVLSWYWPKNSTLFGDQWHVQWQRKVWWYKDYESRCRLFWGPYVKPFPQ